MVVLRVGTAAATTVTALAATVATLVAVAVAVAMAATVVASVVGTVVVTSVLTLRSVSTVGTVVGRRRRGNTGRVSTARRNRVVGVRRVDSGTVVSVVNGNSVSDGLGHTLAVVGRVRVGVGLSLGDNVLAGVSGNRLMRLARLGRVGVDRLERLAGLVVSRLGSDLSDRADSCGNSNGLSGNMANRAVDNGGRALSDGVGLGAVDSAGGVLSGVSRLGHVGVLSIDSSEANVSGLGRRSSINDSLSHASQYVM